MEKSRESFLAHSRFAFDDGKLEMGRDHDSLMNDSSSRGADGKEQICLVTVIGAIGYRGAGLRLHESLHRHVRNSTSRPEVASAGSQLVYRRVDMEREIGNRERRTEAWNRGHYSVTLAGKQADGRAG